MKLGKDFEALLVEVAEIDPDIAAALGDSGPFENGLDLMHVVAELCFQNLYDPDGDSIDQTLEITHAFMTWTHKGKPSKHEGRRIYGSREPGFFLRIGQQPEKLPEGPKEWTPNKEAMIYNFMLTVSKEKGNREMKRIAQDLGWELVSG